MQLMYRSMFLTPAALISFGRNSIPMPSSLQSSTFVRNLGWFRESYSQEFHWFGDFKCGNSRQKVRDSGFWNLRSIGSEESLL